jgi:NTP pyrophosphatase (non-canonical NTP hydrolase)
MTELDLHQSQAIVAQLDKWYIEMGLPQSADFKAAKMNEELGEGIEAYEIFKANPTPENKAHLAGELADILFTTLAMMNEHSIDANEAMHYVFKKNMGRVNPEHVNNVQQDTGLNGRELYKEAKKRHDTTVYQATNGQSPQQSL